MKAIGITSGIGSMLIGARQAGFEIVGNIEWRKYYGYVGADGTSTFKKNFPGAIYVEKFEDLTGEEVERMTDADIAFGHPECGNFSNLRVKKTSQLGNPGDIPLFVDLVKKLRPKFFAMDNLPKALMAYPMKEWENLLGNEYDLFPEWISNYHYGNSQINRKRYFMIGARKEFEFIFRPGEFEHVKYLRDVIDDLPLYKDIVELNHVHWKDSDIMKGWGAHNFEETKGKDYVTLGDFKKVIRDYPDKKNFSYYNKYGESKLRPGYSKIVLDNYSPVMTGGGSAPDNHYRADSLNPLTMRERARIQGCPDDFIFYPLNYMDDPKAYMAIYKQLGKFMPVEFNKYFAEMVRCHLESRPFESSGERFINHNPQIDEAKKWICEKGKCSDQGKVCFECWMKGSCEGFLPLF